MAQPSTDVQVNPSDETIHLGPLAVHFLITGEDASGSVASSSSQSPPPSGWQRRRTVTITTRRRSTASKGC